MNKTSTGETIKRNPRKIGPYVSAGRLPTEYFKYLEWLIFIMKIKYVFLFLLLNYKLCFNNKTWVKQLCLFYKYRQLSLNIFVELRTIYTDKRICPSEPKKNKQQGFKNATYYYTLFDSFSVHPCFYSFCPSVPKRDNQSDF